MQPDYSCQTPLSNSDRADWKVDDIIGSEEENTASASSFARMKFRSVMTQREMEILTTLFPKAARTLACVLRRLPE